MDKEILKNKKVLIGIILIILIILFLFISPSLNFEQTNTTIQQIEYSDVYITKSISLGSERVETYSFDITNPVIAYLIVPKTIATNVSEIKTSGDFKTQVIQVDPILKLTQTNLSPGKKEFTIKTNVGENTHTTIAIIIPLIEYNSFSETEKEELDANYFTNEESKKIMEEFGTNTANVELKKKIDDNKLFFSSSLTQENFEEKYNKKVNINFEVNDSVKTEIINQLNTYFETLPESQSKYQMIAINIDRDNPRGSAYNIGNNSLELVFNNGDFWGGLPIFRHEFSHLHHDFLYGLENTMKTKYYDLLPFSKDWEGNITTIKADNQELKEKYYTYFLSTPFSKDWISINENIEYGQQLTEKNSITKLDDKLYKIVWADPDCEQNKPCKGFVKPYGAAAFREDITTFIEELVKDPQFFYKNGLLEQDYPYRNRYVEKINLLEKNNFITAQEKIAIFSQIETNSNSGQENLNNNNFNNYSTALQQLIDTRKTSEDQTIIVSIPPVLSTFDSFRSTLTNILSTRQTNSAVAFDSNYLMEISFKTEKDYSLPSEIIMSYSKRSSFVIWNGIVEFDEEQEVNTTVVPVLEGTTDLNIEFLRLTKNTINDFNLDLDSDTLDLANKLEENDLKKPIYLVSIIVDTTDFYSQITEKEIGISLPAFKSKKYTTKLTLIQNRCNENINYFGSSVGIELAKDKEKAILDSIVCLGQNFKESIIKEIAQIDVNMKQATTLGEQLIISAIDNDSESVKKLSEERTKQNQEFKKNYLEANDKLIIEVSKLKSYLRQAKSNIVDLNLELTDANNVRVAKDYLIDLNIIYTELDLKLDPTNIDVRNQLVEVEMMDINSIPNISEEVRIAYKQQLRNKYKNKYGSTWGYPLVSDLTKMHHMLEDELIELEKSFALLLLKGRPFTSSSVTSGNCPTRLNIIDSIYNPENEIGYNFQHYKDFRDVVKYLAFNTGYSMSSGSQAILGGERELTDIEKKLKNFQDYSGCKLNIVEFEDPSTAWYDVFKNDTESKIKEFKEQRDSLRERIQSKVKEKTGIEIIGNAVYNVSELKKKSIILNSGFQDYLKPRISFNSPYERIKINKTNATLLEMFETVDENTLVSWLGIKDYKPTHYYPEIDYLRENLDEAFNNSLKSTINSIAYTKFMDFVADMTTGEKLESELAYVDNLLTSQYVLITKKMKEKEDQEKINYLLYNVFTGKLDDNPDAEIDLLLDTTKGLREIKKKLFEGKSFVDIYNVEVEELIKNGISTTPPTFLTYPIADDWTAYEYGFGTESVNTKKIVNPAFISWKDTIKQKGASYEIITAFSNPVMRAEIDKDDIIARNIVANKAKIELATTEEEKQRLVLSKDEESQILLSIADYYYDVGLYEMALQNYDFIKYHLPNTNASQRAEKRIGQMGGNWRMFFGKMYWETFGSISKEFVSLKSIATYLAFYGFIKFVAIPEISAARLTKANTALKQDLLLTQAGSKGAVVTMKQAHEFASINAMKRGVKGYEIINGRLIPLNTSAIYQPSKAWLTTKKFFGTIRNSKTWKILTKDRLVSEAWYQNYVETTVSRKLAYEFSIYSPDEIVGNIIGLAGEGKVASAVKSANRAKQMGLITTRQLQYIDGEIRVLTAKNISSEVEFVSNIGVLQTSHANQQLLPLSSVQQTQMALINPNIVKFDLKNVIKFAKLNKVIIEIND